MQSQQRGERDGFSPRSYSHKEVRDRSISPSGASDSQFDLTQSTSAKEETESAASAAARKHNGTFMGMIRRTSQNVGTSFAASIGGYLPSAVAEMWEPMRDFAWLKLPKPGTAVVGGTGGPLSATSPTIAAPLRSVVAMSSSSPQVMIVTNEGHFYVFAIDLEKGGEGTLLKVYEVGAEAERLGASVMED